MGKIAIYYKYIHIPRPKDILRWQRQICAQLELRGRIILAHEGINGTIGGSDENIQRYIQIMHKHPLFSDLDIKCTDGDAYHFPRLQIKIKPEIVNFGAIADLNNRGKHLTAEQVHALLSEQPDDLVVLDARNDYEWAIGRFQNALLPDIKYFRQLPEYIKTNADKFENKKVVMYCTDGVRCEKASAFLAENTKAKEVYQIDGGISRYAKSYKNGFFKGKNYVFDGRMAIAITNDVLSTCALCEKPENEYRNCANAICNKHFIACDTCIINMQQTCSTECMTLLATGAAEARPERKQRYTNEQSTDSEKRTT